MELEVGSGNGHFLVERAAAVPARLVVGIDLRGNRCHKAIRKADGLGLQNVVVCRGRAEELLAGVAPGRISVLHIYFPDPWPKSRHRRRRFLQAPMLIEAARVLVPGGMLAFATDFFDYFVQARVLIAASDNFSFSTGDDAGAQHSLFGQRFVSSGTAIFNTWAQRRPS